MGSPLLWHRRHAILLAGQLPENTEDAKLVLEAIQELMDNFLVVADRKATPPPKKVIPFAVS